MKRISLFAALIPLSLAAAPTTPTLETMFPRRADVFVDAPGVARLPLPPEVLAGVQPTLSDVRLLDSSGREIPYVIDDGGGSEPFQSRTVAPEVLDVTRERHFPDRIGPIRYEESFTIVIPPDPVEGHWSLVLRPDRREFVARVRVLDADGGLVVEGPLVRLDGLSRRLDTVALPPSGKDREVRVTIESRHGWLSPQLLLQSRSAESGPDELEVPLVLSKTSRERGVSVYELERPRGLVPGALRITTSTPWFDRKVEVWDEGAGRADSLLGSARVARVDAGILVAEERDVAIRDASGDRLLVRIADGDSPSLESVTFHAVVQRPALLFHAGPGSPAATLVFGGHRVRAPHYDLAAFALQPGELVTGPRKAAQPLFGGSAAGRARLGELRANPAWRETPSLGFAQRAGTEVDARRFSHRRSLAVKPSPEGLSRLRLVPEDAAIARPDLADLRVIDRQGLQWPYLLERDADREWRDLPAPEPFRDGRRSIYTLVLPVTPLAPDQIEIDSPVEFFDRAVRVRAQDEQGAERIAATSRLYRRAEDPRPVVLSLAGARVTALSIEVEDGDDAPLPLQVRVRIPVHDLYLVAPEGEYTVVLGDPSAEAARYELAHVRGVVLAAPSAAVDAGALEPNPRFRPRSRFAGPEGLQAGVWAALIVAIGVLLALTVRLVRSEQPAAASSAAPPPTGAPPAAPGASVPDAPPAPPASAPPSDAPPPPV